MKKLILPITLIIFLNIVLCSYMIMADLGFSNSNLPKLNAPIPTFQIFNNGTAYVNSSAYWDDLDSPLEIWSAKQNPFNQSLNTTDNVVFNNVSVTDKLGVGTTEPLFQVHSVQSGQTGEASAVLVTDSQKASTIAVQGEGQSYFLARDITNNIEFIAGTSSSGTAFVGSMTAHDMRLRTNNADRITIKENTGNVGVGTDVPTSKLAVVTGSTNVNSGIRIQGDATHPYGRLSFVPYSGTTVGGVINRGSTTHLYFGEDTDTGNYLFRGTGKVGIGTSTPYADLEIYDSSSTSGHDILLTRYNTGTNTRGSSLKHYYSGGGGGVGDMLMFGVSGDWDGLGQNYKPPNTLGSSRMVLTAKGYLGINTTKPDFPLTVIGSNSSDSITIWAEKNISATGYITRTSIFDKSKNPFDYIKDADHYKENGEIKHSQFYGATKYSKIDTSRPVEVEEEYEVCNDIPVLESVCRNETQCNYVLNKNSNYYDNVCEEVEVCNDEQTYDCDVKEIEDYVYVEGLGFEKVYKEVEENCTAITNQECHNETRIETTYPYSIEEEGVELGAEIDVLRQAVYELNERVKYLEANCVLK